MAKTYKCTNYGICTEADKATIFHETDLEEVDGKFVCPKCGQELEEIEKKPGVDWKLIAIIAAVLVVGGAAIFLFCGKDKDGGITGGPGSGETTQVVDTPKVDHGADSTDTAKTSPEEPTPTEDPKPEPQPKPQPDAKTYTLGWGTYYGPMKGGKPHDIGGEITVTKTYSIDLKNGSFKQVVKGDKIVNTKFKEGKLVQGYIHHSNGEQESFTIGY